MLGIMLQNLRPADCFQNFIKADLLLYHLLLRMLRYAKRSGCRLGLDAFNYSLKLRCISLDHRAVRISLPPCLQEASGHKGRKTFGLRTFLRKRNKKTHRSGVFYFESRRRSACAQGLRRTSKSASRLGKRSWTGVRKRKPRHGGRGFYFKSRDDRLSRAVTRAVPWALEKAAALKGERCATKPEFRMGMGEGYSCKVRRLGTRCAPGLGTGVSGTGKSRRVKEQI